jgi:hypothetical protein
MAQMGHTTPSLTLALYARAMERRDGEPEQLRALLQGDLGTGAFSEATATESGSADQPA